MRPTDPTGRGTSGWTTAIRQRQFPTANLKLLLMILADYINGDDECWPGHARLAPEVGVTERTIQTLLSWLEQRSVIDRTDRARVGGRGRAPSVIRLRYAGLAKAFPLIDLPESLSPETEDVSPESGQRPTGRDEQLSGETSGNRASLVNPTREPPIGTKARKTTIAATFALDDDLRAWAAKDAPSVDLAFETAQWLDYHQAKGDTAKDWRASWRTWMRNAVKFQGSRSNGRSNGHRAPADDPLAGVREYARQEGLVQ